jgi:hypothetical protein
MRKRLGRRMKRDEDLTYEEAKALWEAAEPVEVERTRPQEVSFLWRLPPQLFQRLVEEARRQGKGPGELAVLLLEQVLERPALRTWVIVSPWPGAPAIRPGRPVLEPSTSAAGERRPAAVGDSEERR